MVNWRVNEWEADNQTCFHIFYFLSQHLTNPRCAFLVCSSAWVYYGLLLHLRSLASYFVRLLNPSKGMHSQCKLWRRVWSFPRRLTGQTLIPVRGRRSNVLMGGWPGFKLAIRALAALFLLTSKTSLRWRYLRSWATSSLVQCLVSLVCLSCR